MQKRLLVLVLFILSCGCANQREISLQPNFDSTNRISWENLQSLSGENIEFEKDVKGVDINYVVGWNLDAPGYQKIYVEDQIGTCKVVDIQANYTLDFDNSGQFYLICNENRYQLHCGKALSGILVADHDGLGFYPYYNEEKDNFLFTCERNEHEESSFREKSYMEVAPGQSKHVQPIRIAISCAEGSSLTKNISGFLTEDISDVSVIAEPKYFEAHIKFSDITIYPYSQGEGAGIFGTRSVGNYDADVDLGQVKSF